MKLRFLLLLSVVAIFSSGCAGLSFQSYGSVNRGHKADVGYSKEEVVLNLGEPDTIIKSGDAEAYVYKNFLGSSYFGIVTKVYREDTVVIFRNNVAAGVESVEVGRGLTIFSPIGIDATFPVKTKELTEEIENYEVSVEEPAS
jgi:hypothetical protein